MKKGVDPERLARLRMRVIAMAAAAAVLEAGCSREQVVVNRPMENVNTPPQHTVNEPAPQQPTVNNPPQLQPTTTMNPPPQQPVIAQPTPNNPPQLQPTAATADSGSAQGVNVHPGHSTHTVNPPPQRRVPPGNG